MNDCEVCHREAQENELCEYHLRTLEQLKSAFEDWREAFEIGWKEYLERLKQLEETGQWVIEVVDYLSSQDASSERT